MYFNLNKFVLLINLLVCCEIAGRVVSGFLFCRIVQGKGPRHTQVVETSVKVTPNSPSQDYSHPDDHNLRTYDMTPGFKPFTV